MKEYSIFSKIILSICLCGIVATIINNFTGIINSTIQKNGSGSVICILAFIAAGNAIIYMEKERTKKE